MKADEKIIKVIKELVDDIDSNSASSAEPMISFYLTNCIKSKFYTIRGSAKA